MMEQMDSVTYCKLSAARAFALAFARRGSLWYVFIRGLFPRKWTRLSKASRASEGAALRVYLPADEKDALIASGAARRVGPDTMLSEDSGHNRGQNWERIFYHMNGRAWRPDKVPFWVAGDIEIDGEQIQIKLDGASMMNERTLAEALAAAAR